MFFWADYDYRGRMRMGDSGGEIGVSLYSRYPEDDQALYRLSNSANDSVLFRPVDTLRDRRDRAHWIKV